MYIRNLPFRVIVPVCYQMRLNVVFSGLFDSKKKKQSAWVIRNRTDQATRKSSNYIENVYLCIEKEYHHRNHSRDYFSDLSILSPIISRI